MEQKKYRKEFNIGGFIVLLILFWPGALIYYCSAPLIEEEAPTPAPALAGKVPRPETTGTVIFKAILTTAIVGSVVIIIAVIAGAN